MSETTQRMYEARVRLGKWRWRRRVFYAIAWKVAQLFAIVFAVLNVWSSEWDLATFSLVAFLVADRMAMEDAREAGLEP